MAIPAGSPSDESRGVSTVVGYVVVTAMILVSVVVIVGFGSAALDDTMTRTEQRLAEHTMTLFDSRAAMVALGTSDTQSLSFSTDGGQVETRPDVGWLAVTHANYTGGKTETLFNESLGAVVYERGDSEIAYQGGGVWRSGESSPARMVSPPEFHYRGATLTLPVVRVTGTPSSGSSPRVRIESAADTTRIFPDATTGSQNATGAPYNATEAAYENPIDSGRVEIEVHSPYYEGWAEYARQRTTADVTVSHSNETVRFVLESLAGSPGAFDVPLESNSLAVSGLGPGHPISEFELTLAADGNFQNTHWSLYSTEGGNEFEMHVHSPSQCSGGSYDEDLDVSLYYFNSSTDEVHQWQNAAITPGPDAAVDVDCDAGELSVNFTNTKTTLTYQDIQMTGSNNKWCFGEHIADRRPPASTQLNQHSEDGAVDVHEGEDSKSVNFTVNHYMSRMGTEFDLTVTDGAGNSECLSEGGGQGSSNVLESASSGRLQYAESDDNRFLTYLHLTENRIELELD
jgi:hypothetical protein